MRRILILGLTLLCGSARGQEPLAPPSAAMPAAAKPKVVPMILIKKDKLSGEDPHLPDLVKARHVGGIVVGSYKVCIDPSGSIASVDVIRGISDADPIIIDTVKKWTYKPQPVPICFIQFFEFHIDGGWGDVGAGPRTASAPIRGPRTIADDLADAAVALSQGQPQRAIEIASQVARSSDVAYKEEALRIVGIAACISKNIDQATAAIRANQNQPYRMMLMTLCRRNGLVFRAGEFLPAN